jgi:hypothetical protein
MNIGPIILRNQIEEIRESVDLLAGFDPVSSPVMVPDVSARC